jgi:hypothetical protein
MELANESLGWTEQAQRAGRKPLRHPPSQVANLTDQRTGKRGHCNPTRCTLRPARVSARPLTGWRTYRLNDGYGRKADVRWWGVGYRAERSGKSFLVLFFKKEHFSYFYVRRRKTASPIASVARAPARQRKPVAFPSRGETACPRLGTVPSPGDHRNGRKAALP